MFGASEDNTRHDSSRGSGDELIPARFVWPYGGRRVFLSGSFTRWSEHIPMSPVEGCPTVYQVVYSLTPGYHQYKFLVDGEWRHDEHQLFVRGNNGVVNTIFLSRDPYMIPASFGPETLGRSNMDVDSDPFLRLEAVPMISQVDIELSRHRLSVFMSTHTAYELLPESGKGIPVAPLWDFCKGQFVGVLTALDFILILQELGKNESNLTEEELEMHSILAWKEGKLHRSGQIDGYGTSYPRYLIHTGPYDSLKDVALKLVQNKISTVPVILSSTQDGSFPQLLHLASLAGILKCICRHFRHSSSSLPILQQPVCSFPLGTWVPKIGESSGQPLAMLRPNAMLSTALSLLTQAEVSSVPIVDEHDSLLDIYSRSDITALAKDKAYTQIRLDEMSIHQALQLEQDASSPYGFFNGQRCQMCLRSDPLQKVMERLAIPGVRRLVVVEAGSKRVEGVISLSDVFRFLLG